MKPRAMFSDSEISQMKRLYLEEFRSSGEIAKILNQQRKPESWDDTLWSNQIRHVLKKHGVKMRPHSQAATLQHAHYHEYLPKPEKRKRLRSKIKRAEMRVKKLEIMKHRVINWQLKAQSEILSLKDQLADEM